MIHDDGLSSRQMVGEAISAADAEVELQQGERDFG
jgi:hypothetical protein